MRRPSPRGALERVCALTLTLAIVSGACMDLTETNDPRGSGGPDDPTPHPSVSARPVTEIPFEVSRYPRADAPCGEVEPPDAAHNRYRGSIRRLIAPDATTVIIELCGPDVALPARLAMPAFAINDTGWLTANVEGGIGGPLGSGRAMQPATVRAATRISAPGRIAGLRGLGRRIARSRASDWPG